MTTKKRFHKNGDTQTLAKTEKDGQNSCSGSAGDISDAAIKTYIVFSVHMQINNIACVSNTLSYEWVVVIN